MYNLMNWPIGILISALFLFPIFGINPEKRKAVEKTYEEHYAVLTKHYQIIKNKKYENNFCTEMNHKDIGFVLQKYSGMQSEVIFAGKNITVSATLDGSTYFNVPAFISCIPHRNNISSETDTFALLLVNIMNGHYYFLRFIAQKTINENWMLELELLKHIHLFKRNYEDKLEAMTVWYHNSQKLFHHEFFCSTMYNILDFGLLAIVEKGRTEIGDFILILNDNHWVYLPGIIICEFEEIEEQDSVAYFVHNPEKDFDLEEQNSSKINKFFVPVFETNDTKDGKRTFTIGNYLIA